MSDTYRVKIVRAGNEFEAEGDKEFVLSLLERFEKTLLAGIPAKGSSETGKTQTPSMSSAKITDKSISAGEFIRRIGLKKHVDIVLAFGYFLEKYSGMSSFSSADINGCYYDAKMESSNSSQMVIMNIQRGFMMESKDDSSEGKKKFRLTRTAEQFVEEAISQNEAQG